MEKLLKDKVAIITGAGRGIGEATAKLLAKEGAKVVINDVDEEAADQVKKDIEKEGASAMVCLGDVRFSNDCEKICKIAVDNFGKLDIIVNNAGTTRDRVIQNMTDELWQFIIDINLKGPFNMIRAATPYLRQVAKEELEKEGKVAYHRKIINISSTAAIRGNPGQVNYTSSKAGVLGLTKTVAREWGRFGINVNCVMPGFVETRLTRPKEEPDSPVGLPPEITERTKAQIPLGRIGKPEDIANAILFFASSLSDWITGQVLVVDGGLT